MLTASVFGSIVSIVAQKGKKFNFFCVQMLTTANRLKIIIVHIKDEIRTIAVLAVLKGFIKVCISLKRAVYRFWENDCAYKRIFFG